MNSSARVATFLGLIVLVSPMSASAQCTSDAPVKAKKIKTDLIRAYSSCPGVTFAAPNTATMAGVPGCASPTANSDFQFGPKGRCSFQFQPRFFAPCPTGGAASCSDLKLKLRCKDIRESGGQTIDGESAGGWKLALGMRVTTNEYAGGDMTLVDFPTVVNIPGGSNGSLKLSDTYANLTTELFGCLDPVLGCGFDGCTSIELTGLSLLDPTGAIFATPGSSTR